MDPRKLFVDERLIGLCVFCGGAPKSRDHCPSRVLLDEPLPLDLPVVEACEACNNSFSLDEQYLASLIECVQCGSAEPSEISRPKIRHVLSEYPALAARLRNSKRIDGDNLVWEADMERVRRVVLKLARGHIAYELSLPKIEEPPEVTIAPLTELSDEQRSIFEAPYEGIMTLWPEIGSRAFETMAARSRE